MIMQAWMKFSIAAAAIALIPLAARRQGITREQLVGKRPPIAPSLLWIAVYVIWMLATNAVMDWRGPWDFTAWRAAPMLDNVLRVAAVGVLGPIAEELIFRGFLFARMLRAGINVHATIALLAAGWALLHWSYSLPVIAVIFVAGILLGLARWRTNSVIVPAAMHIIWNLFAVW